MLCHVLHVLFRALNDSNVKVDGSGELGMVFCHDKLVLSSCCFGPFWCLARLVSCTLWTGFACISIMSCAAWICAIERLYIQFFLAYVVPLPLRSFGPHTNVWTGSVTWDTKMFAAHSTRSDACL